MEQIQVRCDRCLEIKPLGRYTKFETNVVQMKKDNGVNASPRFTIQGEDIGEKRGLCKECSKEIAIKDFDSKYELRQDSL